MRYSLQRSTVASLAAFTFTLSYLGIPRSVQAAENIGQTSAPLSIASKTIWTGSIPVCWETSGSDTEKAWVRSSVANTWEKVSAVRFTGWEACKSLFLMRIPLNGIRIKVADEGPHTKGLGRTLDGKSSGMVLNFTFKKWGTDCSASSERESCIRSIGVHEFGHAMGFAHEQNRSDKPSSCTEPKQGSDGDTNVGVWDLSSVMNYCNPTWNNGGALSALDMEGALKFYGSPKQWESGFGGWCSHATGRLHLGDFNGDGISDMLCHDVANGKKWISYGTGLPSEAFSLSPQKNWASAQNWCGHSTGRLYVGDFNGDKRADLLCHDVSTGRKWVALASPTGTFFAAGTTWESPMNWCSHSAGRLHVGDFNGDKRTDLLCHDVSTGRKWVALASPTGTFTNTTWESHMNWCRHPSAQLHIADVNGDGKDDLVCHDVANGWKWFAYARADGSFQGTDWQGAYGRWCSHPSAQFALGKFNSDATADFLCHDRSTGRKWVSFFK